MTKYTRITGKVFGSSADPTGDDPEIGQFGSALAGTYNGTSDVATIQSLSAWQNGFIGAVTPNTQFPPLPEMTGFGKVLSYQLCYLLQQGVAEYDSGTTYYEGNWVSYNKFLYVAKLDNFSNQLPTNTTYWSKFTGGSSRNLGEYVTSSLPLTDTTLHLADGSLLSQTDYPELLSYISSIYQAPTVTTYYAWKNINVDDVFYTLSATPSSGDAAYLYVNNQMIATYTVDHYSSQHNRIYLLEIGTSFNRYSNGDINIYTYAQSFFTSEADWQAEYTAYGECGKYVYNSGANTVRIPSLSSYFKNTNSTTNLGVLTPASIPNIKGEIPASENVYKSGTPEPNYGAFSRKTANVVSGKSDNTNFDNDLWDFDASRISSVYSDTATTINPQSINQLVYIVVKQ